MDWNQISRYICGESSKREKINVAKWMASNSGRKELIELLQRACASSCNPEELRNKYDVDTAWLRYNARYNKDF